MRILMLIALCVLAGCAAAPPESAPLAPSAAPAAAPQNDLSDTEAQADLTAPEKAKFKPPPGYKAKIVGWEILYCSKMVLLGSRFPKEVCMSEAELKEYAAKNDEMRRDMGKATRTCGAVEACGGI
jgi:hypothetical protein